MVRIACVGITVMDRIYYVEGLPTEGGKYVAKRYTEVGGGPAATAAVAAAKLGAQVDFIGRVGDDDTGNSLLAELESLGVNTRYTRATRRPCPRSQRLWWMPKESGLSLIIPARIYYLTPTGLTTSIFRSGMWCWRMCAGMTAQNRRLRWRVRLAS